MTVRLLILDCDGVMTPNTVYVNQDGTEAVRFWRGDGLGIQRVKGKGIPIHVVSSEINPVVRVRCDKLHIACHQGHPSKLVIVRLIAKNAGVAMADVCYLGNDWNDYDCLNAVGYPYIVADAHESVRGYGFRRTQARGGYGAVRELCDLIASGQVQRPRPRGWDALIGWWG